MSERKVVVITGAAQGIGLAAVKKFLKEGWAVATTDIKKKELDVTDFKQGQEVVQAIVENYGRIDALFNDAGITGHRKGILDFDPEEIKQAEIAKAAFFLASDEASAITAVKLPVDAGYSSTKFNNLKSIYGENL